MADEASTHRAKLSVAAGPGEFATVKVRPLADAILAVSEKGDLTLLGTVPTAAGAHCVATDGNGKAFVCDPKKGRLLVFEDKYR